MLFGRRFAILVCLLMLPAGLSRAAWAQSASSRDGFVQYRMAGIAIASQYAYRSVISRTAVPSAGLHAVAFGADTANISGGHALVPLAVGRPVLVTDPSGASEIVTPTAVSCVPAGDCSLTAVFAHAHAAPLGLSSASDGLQEAIDEMNASSGGIVLIDSDWQGTPAQLQAAQGWARVLVKDVRAGTITWYGWNGTSYAAVLSAGAGGAEVIGKDPWIDVRAFGAVCDGATDDGAAIQAAIAAAVAAQGTVFVPDKTCATSIGLTFNGGHAGIVGESPRATIQYIGTAPITAVLWAQGTASAPLYKQRIENLTISGNVHAVNGIELDGSEHVIVKNVRPTNVTGSGLYCRWCVAGEFDNVNTSVFDGFAVTPATGMTFDALAGSASNFSTAGLINTPIVEGVSGTGIVLANASNFVINAGTSEQNAAGIVIASGSNGNTVNGLDLESNTDGDIYVSGSNNQFNEVVAASHAAPSLNVVEGSQNAFSGRFDGITIAAAAAHTQLVGVLYGVLGGALVDDGNDTRFDNVLEAGGGLYAFRRSTVPAVTAAGVGRMDPQDLLRGEYAFAAAQPTILSNTPLSAGEPWRALFIGAFANELGGPSLPELGSIEEVTSASPTLMVGGDTLTFSVNSSGELEAIESGASAHVAFTGSVFVISGNLNQPGTVSAAFKGGVENGCSGITGPMAGGTITVSNACVLGNRPISLTVATPGGSPGFLSFTQTAGSLVISSTSASDTSTVSWVQN